MTNRTNIDENQLIQRCIAQDRKAQYELYQNYVDAMYHTVLRIVVRRADAQDVVQDGFVKIFNGMHQFRGDGGIYGWMKRIMVHESISHLRRQKLKVSSDESVDEIPVPISPTGEIGIDERLQQVHRAIKSLPAGCRQVLTMFLLEGMTHREISESLAISESTSKTQYRRAKQLIRNQIETNYL